MMPSVQLALSSCRARAPRSSSSRRAPRARRRGNVTAMADADLQLFSSTKERRRYTDLADFYAIIKATEHLEKAYARDAIDEARYEKACLKLISQFIARSISRRTSIRAEKF